MKALLCKVLGHDWQPLDPIEYEYGEARALVGRSKDQREEIVGVTWVVDEVCSRCGMTSRWPT